MDQITHEMRMEHWKQIITQCQSRPEGQSAKQWMCGNGISDKSYDVGVKSNTLTYLEN